MKQTILHSLVLLQIAMLFCTRGLYAQSVEPYAALSEDKTVLTFYYDKMKTARNGMDIGPFGYDGQQKPRPDWRQYGSRIVKVVFDASFASCNSLTSTSRWFRECYALTEITDIHNLKTDNVTSMEEMFCWCYNLKNLDLSRFKTEKVKNMNCMLRGCRSLTSLDLSSFKTDKLKRFDFMFSGCRNLKTIYAGDGWSTGWSDEPFKNCESLVGGAGTAYDKSRTGSNYARIDGGPDAPGYFTYKKSSITGIRSRRNENRNSTATYYNLSGRKLTTPQKGINIVNGKKVIIRESRIQAY